MTNGHWELEELEAVLEPEEGTQRSVSCRWKHGGLGPMGELGALYLCIYQGIYGGKYGYIWVYMGIYEGKYGYIWVHMDIHGYIWVYRGI